MQSRLVSIAGVAEMKGKVAETVMMAQKEKSPADVNLQGFYTGGRGRNRTGVDGFAIRCMTTLPPGL